MVKDEGDSPPQEFLVAQANHLIVGGFDPDTNLFTSAVHFLLVNKDKLKKLQSEVRDQFSSYSDITGDAVQDLPWVNAVIEESLRIHTNGAFGLPRISPGDYVDGHYIPKGVSCPFTPLQLYHAF
jgi:cytochrome P450